MAAAVQKLYPDAKFDIGPGTDEGFYYDFDMEHRLVPEDFKEIEKLYRKGVGRVRYNGNVLLAAEMSWIQVKRGDADGAFKTLTEALKKSDDATLKRNHECLMNNRVGHFSNSGLGDQWYSLLLEEPKVKMQRPRSVYR